MKRIIALTIILLLLLQMVGCTSSGPSEDGTAAEKIVIYTGGSSEFIWTAGADEQAVWDAVQTKFYEDTGIKLEFEVNFMGQDMKPKVATAISGGAQVDIMISHTGGGDGIDDWMYYNNNYADLYDAIDSYGENILDNSVWTDGELELDALKRMTNTEGDIIGIPSVINPYKFGILVRKDWMEACGYTDDPSKAETIFEGDKNYILVDNFEAFGNMAEAMKNKYGLNYAITGAVWDFEKVGLVGAYGLDAGYHQNAVYEYNGQKYFIPGGGVEGYKEVLAVESDWASRGIKNPSGNAVLIDQAESEFIAGSTGIFIEDPTITHLISVARKCKLANPEAEFTVLGAMPKDAESTEIGALRNTVAYFAACVYKTSTQVNNIVKFVDWMYSDPDNYLLCTYGIEGVHWQNNGDGTYSYLGDYSLTNKPYSGVLALVENQNVANLIYSGYTEEELSWINTVQNKDLYLNNPCVDYLVLTNDETLNTPLWASYNAISTFCELAWRGKKNPDVIMDTYYEYSDNFMSIIAERGKVMYSMFESLTES